MDFGFRNADFGFFRFSDLPSEIGTGKGGIGEIQTNVECRMRNAKKRGSSDIFMEKGCRRRL